MDIFKFLIFLSLWWCFTSILCIEWDWTVLKRKLNQYRTYRNQYKSFTDYLIKGEFRSEIPPYKFFSEIVFQLVALRKLYGVDIKEASREIRKAALKDNRETKRVNSEFVGLIAQYSMVAGFTWFFILHVQTSLSVDFSSMQMILLLSWQFLGIVLGAVIFIIFKRHIFSSVDNFFYSAYVFRSLIFVSRPVNEILEKSKLDLLRPSKSLIAIRSRFFLLVGELKLKGHIPMDEFSNIIAELWDYYDDQLVLMKKGAAALKLFLILFFVFPGFLFAIYLSMQGLGM